MVEDKFCVNSEVLVEKIFVVGEEQSIVKRRAISGYNLLLEETRVCCTVGHKSHDASLHKKYMEARVMTFVAHCTGS